MLNPPPHQRVMRFFNSRYREKLRFSFENVTMRCSLNIVTVTMRYFLEIVTVTMRYFLNVVTVTMRYSLKIVTVTMYNLFLYLYGVHQQFIVFNAFSGKAFQALLFDNIPFINITCLNFSPHASFKRPTVPETVATKVTK